MFHVKNKSVEEKVNAAIKSGDVAELIAALDVIPSRADVSEEQKGILISAIKKYLSLLENGNKIGSFNNIYALKRFFDEISSEFCYYKGLSAVKRLLELSYLDMKVNLEVDDDAVVCGHPSKTILNIDYDYKSDANYFYLKWETGLGDCLIIEGSFYNLDLDADAMNFNVFVGPKEGNYFYTQIEEKYRFVEELFNNNQ